MPVFTQGGERLLKMNLYFFFGDNHISLNICIDRVQPTCKYYLRVKTGPHDFSLGLALVELV